MKNRKILAIDDSVTVRQLVSLLLKDYQVFTAEDGGPVSVCISSACLTW